MRVREVGVGRGERRARRERERRLRSLATTTDQPLPAEAEGADEAPLPEVPSTLHPADHARQEQERADSPATDGAEGDDVAIPFDSTRRSPSPSPEPVTAMQPPATPPPGYDAPTRPRTTSSATSPARDPPLDDGPAPPPPTSSSRGKLPYTTFQQLPFVPPVPSSVLSSAWTIPPLYADVVASPAQSQSSSEEDPLQPSITVTGANGIEGDVEERVTGPPSLPSQPGLDIPLLSPVSLLGGAATRHTGPPGLFFVSKGQSISGIVTADGKSSAFRLPCSSRGSPGKGLTHSLQSSSARSSGRRTRDPSCQTQSACSASKCSSSAAPAPSLSSCRRRASRPSRSKAARRRSRPPCPSRVRTHERRSAFSRRTAQGSSSSLRRRSARLRPSCASLPRAPDAESRYPRARRRLVLPSSPCYLALASRIPRSLRLQFASLAPSLAPGSEI